jgi:CspA family cold shock protein
LLFTLALKFNVIAAERVENEKKTAESVSAVAKADVLKVEMKGLSMPESAKLVKTAVDDAKAIELSDRKTGRVKWFNKQKGFGFIEADNGGSDLYFHVRSINSKNKDLETGQKVSYIEVQGQKGPQADSIEIVD